MKLIILTPARTLAVQSWQQLARPVASVSLRYSSFLPKVAAAPRFPREFLSSGCDELRPHSATIEIVAGRALIPTRTASPTPVGHRKQKITLLCQVAAARGMHCVSFDRADRVSEAFAQPTVHCDLQQLEQQMRPHLSRPRDARATRHSKRRPTNFSSSQIESRCQRQGRVEVNAVIA
eukprot:CAMPEP_0115148476 /NCGR_PEP_ID=MMETSP0227-20121206/63894_1 /TAXON_ID=89957 /ORGANISM="Polarella glacialis, Strain CCMP 1383" /LENGTH=177 /DNA_ID=CAMNT_0002558513 /DNA_START=499 /DNA_END=1029 /DNA_ORIENTATION=-